MTRDNFVFEGERERLSNTVRRRENQSTRIIFVRGEDCGVLVNNRVIRLIQW